MSEATSRDILAANIRRLIQADTAPGDRPSVRDWAMKRELDVKLIDRLSKAENAVTLTSLEKIAEACGLQTWHLLLPDFDPKNPPTDAPITDADRVLLARLRKLLDPPTP